MGILPGVAAGFLLYFIFEKAFALKNRIRNSLKVIVILGTAFLLMAAEKLVEDHGPVFMGLSGLLQ